MLVIVKVSPPSTTPRVAVVELRVGSLWLTISALLLIQARDARRDGPTFNPSVAPHSDGGAPRSTAAQVDADDGPPFALRDFPGRHALKIRDAQEHLRFITGWSV